MIVHTLKTLIKQKTCFKNPENPACIDLILTNSRRSFQKSSVFEIGLSDFHELTILNKHAPMKQKYLRANQGRFITKYLHKAIMKRSRLWNKFLRDRTDISREEYKKQRNICVNLLKKAEKDHFTDLDIKPVTDDKKLWQTVKPLFSNKVKDKTVIKLVETQ